MNGQNGQYDMKRVNHIHFVGIGGAGMCGIAEVLHNLGYVISGTDLQPSAVTRQLAALGIRIGHEHKQANINGSDVVVYSGAVSDDNPEMTAARARKIPTVPRVEMLSELMRLRQGIAIAGTHGKTTTTSLIASLLAAAGLDPTYVIGGQLNSTGSNAKLGAGRFLVAEADESDGSFMRLSPVYAVLTNIDADHLDGYQHSMDKLRHSFAEFLQRLPFYGLAVVCLDDPACREIIGDIHKPVVTYGVDTDADYRAGSIRYAADHTSFELTGNKLEQPVQIHLNMPGRHNVLNALAGIALALELDVGIDHIVSALKQFQGIARRASLLGEIVLAGNTVQVVDDYAHHPTEISAIHQAISDSQPDKRIVVVFQPHRYSRTRDLFEEFCAVLSPMQVLLILDIYPAGEPAISGIDSAALCDSIRVKGKVDPLHITAKDDLVEVLGEVVSDGDVLLILGAGDIGLLGQNLIRDYGTTLH
ncbi:MAG: UDP-N-acetylmuramate--L-alanine ligase [Gammaproteobacteria bacterium]